MNEDVTRVTKLVDDTRRTVEAQLKRTLQHTDRSFFFFNYKPACLREIFITFRCALTAGACRLRRQIYFFFSSALDITLMCDIIHGCFYFVIRDESALDTDRLTGAGR